MREGDRRRVSRRLALVLRHDPQSVGLHLDPAGWVPVPQLLDALTAAGLVLTRVELEEVVAADAKQRYAITGQWIRARYGHSVAVDLGLAAAVPPATLFHGTARHVLPAVMRAGLLPQGRRLVHLSGDVATARTVGARHGAPVVLAVDAGAMADEGRSFWHPAPDGWLTTEVPTRFLRPL